MPPNWSTMLALPLRIIPAPLCIAAAGAVINHVLRGQELVERLRLLDGKRIAVRLRDVPLTACFRFKNGRLDPTPPLAPDATISGSLRSFVLLAAGREDPDTLFFRRDLCIEGDTATAVYIKNVLDALEYDWETHFDAVLPPSLAERAKRLRRAVLGLRPHALRRDPSRHS